MSVKPFRLGVDGRAFGSPAGGVRRYVWELYRAIRAVDPDVEIVAIGAADATPLPEGIARRNAIAFPTNLGWTGLSLPLAVRGAGLDVFHAPAYTAPLWGVHPQLLTLHDVSCERRPEWNAYRNDRFRRAFYRRGALAADRIVTDSAFSKAEIMAAYAVPADRIHVVPLAAAATFTPGRFDPSSAPPRVRQPYVLHVGDLHVRRNLSTALSAILQIRRSADQISTFPDSQISRLVCAGVDRGEGDRLTAQARNAGDADALVLTGTVGEDALVNLYRGAALLAYPSRYEGFGLPILEAMGCGIPVVAANSSSLPELTGDAGLLVAETDVDAWSRAIAGILGDPVRARHMADASVRQAATFSWTRTARETLALLRALAS